MKIFKLVSALIFLGISNLWGQDFTISNVQKNAMQSQAINLIDSYEISLNNLGDPSLTVNEKEYFIADMLETFFTDKDVLVFNDLDPENQESENLKVEVYLNNIVVKYSKGVSFNFKKSKISDPYYLDDNNAFIKIEIERQLKTPQVENAENTVMMDVYLKYAYNDEKNFQPPSIYSITNHIENITEFRPIKSEQEAEILDLFFVNPRKNASLKRGQSFQVQWFGNPNTKPVKLELMKGDRVVRALNPQISGRSYEWNIPSNLPLGDDYKLKIINISKPENDAESDVFTIKRKIPLLMKIIPVAGIVAVTSYIVLTGAEKKPESDDILPGPPGLP